MSPQEITVRCRTCSGIGLVRNPVKGTLRDCPKCNGKGRQALPAVIEYDEIRRSIEQAENDPRENGDG